MHLNKIALIKAVLICILGLAFSSHLYAQDIVRLDKKTYQV